MGRLAVAVAVALWAVPISLVVNTIVPNQYMDEIFHIPQMQKYCNGDFTSWDPMITTPPGLYILSLAYVGSLFPGMLLMGVTQSLPDLCSPLVLRLFNVIAAIVCGILIHYIILSLRPGFGKKKATIYAIMATLYPVHWFFTFLYYTDVASLAAVLAMYMAILKKHFSLGAAFGAVSIFLRQTNAIWVLFFAANGAICYVQYLANKKDHASLLNDEIDYNQNASLAEIVYAPNDPGLRRRKRATSVQRHNREKDVQAFSLGIIEEISYITVKFWNFKWEVLYAFYPFIFVLMAFAAFVVWNGGVVLGAKDAHTVSLHLVQMLYFGLFSAGSLAVLHFTPGQAKYIYHWFTTHKVCSSLILVTSVGASFVAVQFFSIAHPYLLADNRHYPFYIWRKIVQANWMTKYALIPLYVYSWFSIIITLGKMQTRIWVSSYVLSVALAVIPAPLIEFRYFTIPFVILLLHSPAISEKKMLLMGFFYVCVNLFTMAVFLFRPFRWDNEPGIQRFMW